MLYQLSRKAYNNLYSTNRGYFIGKWLQFTNKKIEQRFIKGLFISNIQSLIKMHLFQLILSVLDCFYQKEYPYLAYIHITFSILYLLWIKKSQTVIGLQIFSFLLQLYYFFRFAQMDLPYEFFILLYSIWGINNVITYKPMIAIFLFIFITLSQVFHKNRTLIWPLLLSQIGQRDVYSIQVLLLGNHEITISELEVEYIIFSIIIYYYFFFNVRQNWKVLDQSKRSERAYVNLFQQNKTPILIVNQLGNILELNEMGKEVIGERRVSYANSSFFKLIQNKQELESLKQAFDHVNLTKESINLRINIKSITQESRNSITTTANTINNLANEDQAKGNSANNNTQNMKSSVIVSAVNGDNTKSNSNTRNGLNTKSNENSVVPSPQMPSLNSKKQNSISSPPVRHPVQIAPPNSKNTLISKIPYPFLPEQFDDILKDEYLQITENQSANKYYLITISPYIWKESTAFLINLVDISETQDFVKISNFFMKNLNERLISVLSHTEEDYQKWSNLAQLSQIKQTDLRELSAIISEQHNILGLTSLLKYLNQMYIGQEKGKPQDFQIINLIIQTIEVHSVRVQNYLKKIDLAFDSFPQQVNGDPSVFYFVLHNLIYLMTYNCEYNEVDLSLNCTFLTYVDRSSSLVLSFDFEFTATQDQIEFFQKITKKYEDFKRPLVQNDLKGHDILETLYLLTLNSIKLNEGQLHIELVDLSKKNDNNNQNQSVSQQNIAAPQSQQLIKQEPPAQNKDESNQDNKQDQPDIHTKRLKVVLEQVFNTAEMHTVVKRQGENSIMDSPAITPLIDKKGVARKHNALSKPPQINLSHTRFRENKKEKYQWRQSNEEEKKQQIALPQRRLPGEYQKQIRKIQNHGIDSDENIPNPIQRSNVIINPISFQYDISPLTIKQGMRKASTHTLNVGGGVGGQAQQQQQQQIQSQQIVERIASIDEQQNNQSSNHTLSNQNIPGIHNSNSQAPPTKDGSQQNSSHQISLHQIPQNNSSGNINFKKNLENISESAENIERLTTSNLKQNQVKKKNEQDSYENQDIIDLLNEEDNTIASNNLKKEIKTYLKLYNSNIIKDISKIVKNVLSASKIQEDLDLRFIDKSSDNLSVNSHHIAQFCSPQLPSTKLRNDSRYRRSPLIHSAFAGYVNTESTSKNKYCQNSVSTKRRDSNHANEETPKSVVVSARTSKTNFPSIIINSPLVANNFKFRGDSRSSDHSKDSITNNKNYIKQDTKQIPWNEIIPFGVHQSRLKRHVRKWTLQDVWNKIYNKTDTVLVISADFGDQSVMQQVFQQKKDLGRELDFSKLNKAFEKYMQNLRDAQVYKYILVDLRLDQYQIENLIDQVRHQETQSKSIPRTNFVGFNCQEHAQYRFQLDFNVVGKVEVLKLLPFIKTLKEKK